MDDQSAVIAFLSDPATHAGAKVERVDTHISHVFLAGDRAYKLKRAVTLPFLDFAKLEDRQRFCQKELEINRRAAPMLYLGLKSITREADGRLAWDGKGEKLDQVIEMARFDEATLFDHLAAKGQLTRRQIEDLADVVVEMHQGGESASDWGGTAGIAHVIDTNDVTFRQFIGRPFEKPEIDALAGDSRQWLARLAPLLERRRLSGRVRRCHGDLHLGNICMMDGRPVPFDAIEFNEEFALIDQFYDLSFLLMDFDRRNLGEFAALLLSRCLAASNDVEALAALPLFLSLRAAIRSHVAAATGRPDEARSYFDWAKLYLHPNPPRLVAVGGLSGSGKSHLARQLAPQIGARPGALVLRSDVLRKHLMGVSPETALPPSAYEEAVTERVYQNLLDQAERALHAGHAVIIDAVSAKPDQRRAIAALAGQTGVPFQGLWLNADAEALKTRVAERRNNASDATVAVVERQLRYDVGVMDWTEIDSSGDRADTLRQAKAVLA